MEWSHVPFNADTDAAIVVVRVLAYASSRGIEEITASSRLSELGIDSVGITATGVVLESELGLQIDQDELFRYWVEANVGDLVSRLVELQSQAENTP
jgi:acyl carrier protein